MYASALVFCLSINNHYCYKQLYVQDTLARFPSKKYCVLQYELLGLRITHLEKQQSLMSYRRRFVEDQINGLKQQRRCFDLITDVQNPDSFSIPCRYEKLLELKYLLEESQYLLGQLPVPGEDY